MPSSSLMNFHHDQSWPLPGAQVFLTPNFVWYPLINIFITGFSGMLSLLVLERVFYG